jgi:hypothetical protein
MIVGSFYFLTALSYNNPFSEKSLYMEFSNIINNNIINFNYHYFLEEIDDSYNINEINLNYYLEYRLINKFYYSSLISNLLISKLFYNLDNCIINEYN